MPAEFTWPLPASPQDPVYPAMRDDIASTAHNTLRQLKFRTACEADFWFFCRYATSFGDFVISDTSHPSHGQHWCDQPWVFHRIRDVQRCDDTFESGVFFNWPRFHFKTEIITKLHTIWTVLRNPSLTTAILTYKTDSTGEAMFDGIRDELEKNPRLREHWPDVLTPQRVKDFTKLALTVERPLGPREPSISLHSLDRLPTSMHVDRIKVDDAVVKETVRSQLMIFQTRDAMRKVVPLGKDQTLKWWIGTVWDKDDPYMMALRDGFFTRRDHWSPYGPGPAWKGTPVLRSERMLNEWHREFGEYDWSCQMIGEPVARGQQTFLEEWLNESQYTKPPKVEREGKRVYFVVDFAGGGPDGDFMVVLVVGLAEDRHRYVLDMHREKFGLVQMMDLLFRLVKVWEPELVLIEQFGASGHYEALKREMEHRSYRFNLRKLPAIKRNKVERIRILQPHVARKEFVWPAQGFGHGSREDRRDTLEQFRTDEYRLWVPIEGAVLYDDMLDSCAWTVQPEVKGMMAFPERSPGYEEFDPFHQSDRPPADDEVSPWVTWL